MVMLFTQIEWKNDKSINSPAAATNLKLLHRGKFADRPTTLDCINRHNIANGLHLGAITVVHILVKNDIPEVGTLPLT
jgi:hypothetical protein